MASNVQLRLGKAIRRLRSEAGYSQESFALRTKIDRAYMGRIERGLVNLSLQHIDRVAKALGLTPGQLLGEADQEK